MKSNEKRCTLDNKQIARPVLLFAASHLWERKAAPKWNIWIDHKKSFSMLEPSDAPLLTVDKFVCEHIGGM